MASLRRSRCILWVRRQDGTQKTITSRGNYLDMDTPVDYIFYIAGVQLGENTLAYSVGLATPLCLSKQRKLCHLLCHPGVKAVDPLETRTPPIALVRPRVKGP